VVERVRIRLQELAATDDPATARIRSMLIARVLIRIDSVKAYSESLDDLFETLRPAYLARRKRYFKAETEIFAKVVDEGIRKREFELTDAPQPHKRCSSPPTRYCPLASAFANSAQRATIARNVEHLGGHAGLARPGEKLTLIQLLEVSREFLV